MENPNLFNALAQRQPQLGAPTPPPQQWAPPQPFAGTPPNPKTQLPPAQNRFNTAQQMQQGVANGWSPNPTLTRILASRQAV